MGSRARLSSVQAASPALTSQPDLSIAGHLELERYFEAIIYFFFSYEKSSSTVYNGNVGCELFKLLSINLEVLVYVFKTLIERI